MSDFHSLKKFLITVLKNGNHLTRNLLKILKKLNFFNFLIFFLLCASGGSKPDTIPVLDQTTLAPVDEKFLLLNSKTL
ncbi:MAG: hypothetical protein CM15mP86_13280 [Gammaproteobacteria bacterium]|nr:MAG: hypothetical protein CM15mP86_13280 [Gammaproteobacteria bacterium]